MERQQKEGKSDSSGYSFEELVRTTGVELSCDLGGWAFWRAARRFLSFERRTAGEARRDCLADGSAMRPAEHNRLCF